MEVIAIISRKGGVGKSVTAQALGAGLIRKGARVLYVDLDSQYNLTFAVGAAPGGGMTALKKQIPVRAAIQHTKQGDILAGSEEMAAADTILNTKGSDRRLKGLLAGLPYDYCIIDTPAQLGILTVNALTAADGAIVPVQADVLSLRGLAHVHQIITTVQEKSNPDLRLLGILITRYNGRSVLARDMKENIEAAAEQMGTVVFEAAIRECVAIREAQAMRKDIFTYAPRSNAAKDYGAFVEEFVALS